MTLYWVLFTTSVLARLSPVRLNAAGRRMLALLGGCALILIIGTRDGVGCDWDTYLRHFQNMQDVDLASALSFTDPAYALLNWLFVRAGWSVHAVNMACATIFVVGLLRFCGRQPAPVLALLVSIPYLVVVVSMGYTRQASAAGFLMLAFNAFSDGRGRRYLLWVLLAASFHRSAAMFAPLVVFVESPSVARDAVRALTARTLALTLGAVLSAVLLVVFVGGAVDRYTASYVESDYEARGDLYRIALNTLAAAIFLLFRRRWKDLFADARLHLILALAAVSAVPLLWVSSVGADRMSLYLLPLQLAVFSRLPLLAPRRLRHPVAAAVMAAYAAVLYVWLNFANHAFCWVPYQSTLL